MDNVTDSLIDISERRLGGVSRLYGEHAYQILKQSHVVVVGLGGVGSWAAEALARSAVGELTLIDFDHISISNTNRQLHAMEGEFGKSKVEVMTQRLLQINPELKINSIDDFLKPENLDAYLPKGAGVLDATDDIPTKLALAVWHQSQGGVLVMSGGAGGKMDPTQIEVSDLSKATHDAMLAKIRSKLRAEHGFEKDPKRSMHIQVVFSREPRLGASEGGLSCSGYGSTVTVTASFGFVAASELIKQLLHLHKSI
jgi:tRNA threonylcarbamoyladenosine dehydratase